MNGYNNRRPAGSGGARKSSRYGPPTPARQRRAGSSKGGPGGFGTSRKGRKFKARGGDGRRSHTSGNRGSGGTYEDGYQAGLAHAVRIGYRL